METPGAVANYFISKSISEDVEMTPMKLVKLVYIAHGWHLAVKNEALFEENVQAWKYGPVIQSLYYLTKNSGGRINELLMNTSVGSYSLEYSRLSADEDIRRLLDKVWEVYKTLDGPMLSTLTHKEGTPWYIVWHHMGGKDRYGAIIPNDLIKDHYRQKGILSKKGN